MLLLRFSLVAVLRSGEVFTLCVFLLSQAFPKLVFLLLLSGKSFSLHIK